MGVNDVPHCLQVALSPTDSFNVGSIKGLVNRIIELRRNWHHVSYVKSYFVGWMKRIVDTQVRSRALVVVSSFVQHPVEIRCPGVQTLEVRLNCGDQREFRERLQCIRREPLQLVLIVIQYALYLVDNGMEADFLVTSHFRSVASMNIVIKLSPLRSK